jgi:hypothetical protein
MLTRTGKWYRPANNYELLNELEAFSVEELNELADAFKKMTEQIKDNSLKMDERGSAVITDFIEKARRRLMTSQQDIQEDYEHANQVNPSDVVSSPKGGSGSSGGNDKAQTQQSGNNNGGSNVGS